MVNPLHYFSVGGFFLFAETRYNNINYFSVAAKIVIEQKVKKALISMVDAFISYLIFFIYDKCYNTYVYK